MSTDNFSSLDMTRFLAISQNRKAQINMASGEVNIADKPINALANMLHPHKQYLKVSKVIVHNKDCKSYILIPDEAKGTVRCAYFDAGQYLSVFFNIEGRSFTRAYSISSSPKDSLNGFYRLTVKALSGGVASRYILDNWSEGTEVTTSDPTGVFTYEPLRDANHIIGIAGGSGITPFMSLANAVADGDEDCSLTVLYGCKTFDDIVFKSELDSVCSKCKRVKVVYVLSEEQREGCESGYITAELIKRCMTEDLNSVFVCGSSDMYGYIEGQLQKLNIEKKYIRYEHFGEPHGGRSFSDFPKGTAEEVRFTVHIRDDVKEFTASTDDTVLQSLEKNGIKAPSRCRSGECGFCNSYLKSGKVFVPKGRDKRRMADEVYNHIHPCCSFPLTDIEIYVSDSE